MPRLKPEEIIKMVDQHEVDTQPLRDRMEEDWDRYRLTDYAIENPVTGEPEEGYAAYTSNEPKNYSNKIISWLTSAEYPVRVPHLEEGAHDPDVDNQKERFAIGCLRAADERLTRRLDPPLRNQLALFVAVRGGFVGGRALLVKRPDGSTYVDVTPWDPLHTHWGVGSDGLAWAAYKIKKTRRQIQTEYGLKLPEHMGNQLESFDPEKEGFWVYDYYDPKENTVIMDGRVLKKWTPHGSPRVPIFMYLVGNIPLIQPLEAVDVIADVGESVFEANRGIYDKNNFMMSVMLELTARALKQPIGVWSKDGKKTLPEDPYKSGTEVSLAEGEEIKPLGLLEMAKETGIYMGQVSSEIQRGSLPHSAYGELQFQLSGYAINTLRQGIETVLSTRLQAMSAIQLQIVNLLYDQYMTGAFEPFALSGVDKNRSYFRQTIVPETLFGSCDYEIKPVAQLPQDDMSKWAMAEIAARGKFLAKGDILDNIIGLQDSQQAINKVKAEMSEQGLPEATLYTLMMALAEMSSSPDDEYAQRAMMYLAELARVMAVKTGIMPNFLPGGPGQNGGQPQLPAAGGTRPEVMPNAMTGAPPPGGQSNNGPGLVAAGTPRPAAQGQADQGPQL